MNSPSTWRCPIDLVWLRVWSSGLLTKKCAMKRVRSRSRRCRGKGAELSARCCGWGTCTDESPTWFVTLRPLNDTTLTLTGGMSLLIASIRVDSELSTLPPKNASSVGHRPYFRQGATPIRTNSIILIGRLADTTHNVRSSVPPAPRQSRIIISAGTSDHSHGLYGVRYFVRCGRACRKGYVTRGRCVGGRGKVLIRPLCCLLILIASRGVRDQHFGPWQFSSKYSRNTLPRWFAVVCCVRSGSADGSQPDYTSTDEGISHFGTPNGGDESTLVSSATGAAGVLAGWAISLIGKKAHNLSFVLRRPSYLPYQFAPTDMQVAIPPAETLRLPCRARQNLQPAADRHCPYPMAANLKACSWVATRPARIPGGLLAAEARWGGVWVGVNGDADDWSMCLSLLPKPPLSDCSFHACRRI